MVKVGKWGNYMQSDPKVKYTNIAQYRTNYAADKK